MRIFTLALSILALAFPALAFAGSQTYSTPGTYTFTVPEYAGTLTITVSGAGGGGAGGCGFSYFDGPNACSSGGDGGQSALGGIIGFGGFAPNLQYGAANSGASGGAIGGDSNAAGDGALGGAGGMSAGKILTAPGGAGSTDYYPGERVSAGGNGGRATKSFTTTTLVPGTSVTVVVGAGGAGGAGTEGATIDPNSCIVSFGDQSSQQPVCSDASGALPRGTDGSAGEDGSVSIVWADTNEPPNPPIPAPTCSVIFDRNPIAEGGSTTMRWTSTNADLFYINNVSYVGASGSAQVSSVGDYTGTVFGAGGSASCPAVLSGPNQCVAEAFACNPASGNLVNNCGEVTACPFGCSATTNTCNQSCTPQNVCNAAGTSVVNSCTGATVKNCASTGQICSAAVCVPPPVTFVPFPAIDPNSNPFTASGHLEARPAVVRAGETTNLYWNVANVASCTVTGNNGDGTSASATGPWTTLASGAPGKVSTGIMNQTIYTLFCRALSGAAPATIQESVTVNIIPSFEEI